MYKWPSRSYENDGFAPNSQKKLMKNKVVTRALAQTPCPLCGTIGALRGSEWRTDGAVFCVECSREAGETTYVGTLRAARLRPLSTGKRGRPRRVPEAPTGAELRAIRIEHGLTQTELAMLLDISLNSLGRYERGQRRIKYQLAVALDAVLRDWRKSQRKKARRPAAASRERGLGKD